MKTVFIYALACPMSGQVRYVGKAINPRKRLAAHCYRAGKDKDHRSCWINSLLKVGHKPVLEVLDEVAEEFWPQWEVAYIQFFLESGCDLVNSNAGGEGGNSPTKEVRLKISEAARKWKRGPRSAETCAKLSEANTGKIRSEETCLKIGAASKGRKKSAESRAKTSASLMGNKNCLGHHPSEEARANQSAAQTGRKNSEETLKKMSASAMGRKNSLEHCARISASRKFMFLKKKALDTLQHLADTTLL